MVLANWLWLQTRGIHSEWDRIRIAEAFLRTQSKEMWEIVMFTMTTDTNTLVSVICMIYASIDHHTRTLTLKHWNFSMKSDFRKQITRGSWKSVNEHEYCFPVSDISIGNSSTRLCIIWYIIYKNFSTFHTLANHYWIWKQV